MHKLLSQNFKLLGQKIGCPNYHILQKNVEEINQLVFKICFTVKTSFPFLPPWSTQPWSKLCIFSNIEFLCNLLPLYKKYAALSTPIKLTWALGAPAQMLVLKIHTQSVG